MNLPRSAVLKYYCYRACISVGLIAPIWVLFVKSKGLSYTEIMLLDGIWGAGLVLGEIPTGYLGDRMGRKNSLLVGTALVTLATAGMGLAGGFWSLAFVYTVWALGTTFRSGTQDAWLYDVLAEQLEESTLARINGRGGAIALTVAAVGALAGGYLAEYSLSYPFFVTAVVNCLGFAVLLTFPETDVTDEEFTLLDALPIIRKKLTEPPLRSFVAAVALLYAVVAGVVLFTQPISADMGIEVAEIGWMYSAFMLVSAAGSYVAGDVKSRFGLRRWFVLMPPLVGGLLALLWLAPVMAIPAFFAVRAVESVTHPLAGQYVNDLTPSVGRATVLSSASMVYSLVTIPLAVGSGVVADAIGPMRALAVLGGFLLVGSVALQLWESPVEGQQTARATDQQYE